MTTICKVSGKRNRPQAEPPGAKDTGPTPGGAVRQRILCIPEESIRAVCVDLCQREECPDGGGLHRSADQPSDGNPKRKGKACPYGTLAAA